MQYAAYSIGSTGEQNCPLELLFNKNQKICLAIGSFDPPTLGLWAQCASSAPNRWPVWHHKNARKCVLVYSKCVSPHPTGVHTRNAHTRTELTYGMQRTVPYWRTGDTFYPDKSAAGRCWVIKIFEFNNPIIWSSPKGIPTIIPSSLFAAEGR